MLFSWSSLLLSCGTDVTSCTIVPLFRGCAARVQYPSCPSVYDAHAVHVAVQCAVVPCVYEKNATYTTAGKCTGVASL